MRPYGAARRGGRIAHAHRLPRDRRWCGGVAAGEQSPALIAAGVDLVSSAVARRSVVHRRVASVRARRPDPLGGAATPGYGRPSSNVGAARRGARDPAPWHRAVHESRKEEIVGLVAALRRYVARDHAGRSSAVAGATGVIASGLSECGASWCWECAAATGPRGDAGTGDRAIPD